MKLIIEVEKDYYEMLKYFVEHGDKYKPIEIIASGIPYEERTQGDLISRSALKEKLTLIKLYGGVYCKAITEKDIDDAPTVELRMGRMTNGIIIPAEKPKGEWLTHRVAFHITCPFCGCNLRALKNEVFEGDYDYNFCPNCGADLHKPNCVRCDHFGKCDGCEKGEEE